MAVAASPAYCAAADQLKTSVQDLGNVDVAKNGLDPLKAVLRSVQSSAQTFVSGPFSYSCGPFADC